MSNYSQDSFLGGMNLLTDDTRLKDNEYRVGVNLRNRYDVLKPVFESVLDQGAPLGIKQEMVTFGNYIILFVSGRAWYRYYSDTGWIPILGFEMDEFATRYWTVAVPVGLTNYVRQAASNDSLNNVKRLFLEGIGQGNLPGLLVQDNKNQPRFIFLETNGKPAVRITQTYEQWNVTYDSTTLTLDKREYVPIGNSMAWTDGILYVTSPNKESIYRSVSGRPLDFVVNVKITGAKGGDATTTAYSVGVGGISCLRPIADGSLFVSASNANFLVSKNTTPNAPTEWGEYTFIRKFLFNATNLSDRTIFDSLGDTRFIDLTGVRSFNAIQYLQNEGRNSQFTSKIQLAFEGIIQDANFAATILYDNYEFYAMQSSLGPSIVVYDTISESWASFDISQTNGKRIKQLAKIESTIQRLFAITEDDKLYTLYSGTKNATAILRTSSVNFAAESQYTGKSYRVNDPSKEVKPQSARIIFSEVKDSLTVKVTPFVNNRVTRVNSDPKTFPYKKPEKTYNGVVQIADTDTMLLNTLFSFPNCEQGWDAYLEIEWNSGTLTQYSYKLGDVTPMNPLNTQPN